MKKTRNTILKISLIVGVFFLLFIFFWPLVLGKNRNQEKRQTAQDEKISWDGTWIDTHSHLSSPPFPTVDSFGLCASDACTDRLLHSLDAHGISLSLIMHTPTLNRTATLKEEEEKIQETARAFPARLAYVGGGGSLNPLLQLAGEQGLSDALKKEFEALARGIAESGAKGFGEVTALHLSRSEKHPFEEIPPDGELFSLLADLAAEYDIPIDLHMDPVPADMSTPPDILRNSSKNPSRLKENLTAFERLLSSHPRTKIIWAHVGRNHLGHEKPELYRRLLSAHSNLYLQMDLIKKSGSLTDEQGKVLPDWLGLMKEFPDRFVMGSDTFYGVETIDDASLDLHEHFFSQLPGALAQKIATENPKKIYQLE